MLTPGDRVKKWVRAARRQRGWSQADLARAAGIKSRATIQKLESGVQLREGYEAAIEAALGVPLGSLDEIRAGGVRPLEMPGNSQISAVLTHSADDPEFWISLRDEVRPEIFDRLWEMYEERKRLLAELRRRSSQPQAQGPADDQ